MGKNRKLIFWISLLGVLLITSAIYYPTLMHTLKGETYCYFLDTMGDDTPKELITNWWNYESVRQIAPGDRLLFRPLLFITLGLEKAYFGGHYMYWRIAALMMHLFAVACLFRLLWKIKPGILATLMAVFFGTTYLCINTLLYEQIASYSLFAGLLLCGFYYVYQGTENGNKKDLILATIFMLLACFFHETGIIFTALFIGYFWWERNRLGSGWKYWSYAFIGVLLIWSAVYFPSKFINPVRFLDSELNNLMSIQTFVVGIKGSLVLLTRWVQQAFLPSATVINPMTEWWAYPIDIQYYFTFEPQVASERYLIPVWLFSIYLIINIGALLIAGYVYINTKTKDADKKVRNSFILLVLFGLIMFLFANSVFRTNSHGGNYLVDHNFNLYIWTALLVFFIYLLISLQRLQLKHTILIVLCLLTFIGFNAPRVFNVFQSIKVMQTETREYFHLIDDFIVEHKAENDLSFKILNSTEMQDNLELTYWKVPENIDNNFPTPETLSEYIQVDSSIPQILYYKYWDNENPKYLLSYHPNNSSLEIINE